MYDSERELISEMKKRNPDAFDDLISIYTKPVYYLTYHILSIGNSKEDIEECVSDVFVEAWGKIDQFDPQKGDLRKWILMLAKYRALTYKRKLENQRIVYMDDYQDDQLEDTDNRLLTRETQQVIMDTLKTFSTTDRQLFIRKYYLNEPTTVLMQSLALSRSAIDNRLLRCRKKIKEALSCG